MMNFTPTPQGNKGNAQTSRKYIEESFNSHNKNVTITLASKTKENLLQVCVESLLPLCDFPDEILKLEKAISEIFFAKSETTRKILATAKAIGFVYANLVSKLFPELHKQNISAKIEHLVGIGLLVLISPQDLEGKPKENFIYLMGVLHKNTSANPRKIRRNIKLYAINRVYEKLVNRFFERHQEYLLKLKDWKEKIRLSHRQIKRLIESKTDPRLLFEEVAGNRKVACTKVQFCDICRARFGEFCFYIPHIKRFVCEKCEKKIRSQSHLATYSVLRVKVIRDGEQA